MNRRASSRFPILPTVLFLAIGVRASASTVWLVGAVGETNTGTCKHIRWVADPLLYNVTSEPADVRVVHVSNGGGNENMVTTIAPGSALPVSLAGGFAQSLIWVTQLEIPDGIVVDPRMEYFERNACSMFPPDPQPLGKVRMPIFSRLAAPDEQQVHVGTDLGEQPVHENVTVYNAGKIPALASVGVHLASGSCYDSSIRSYEFEVPADTAVQVPLGRVSCSAGVAWPSYVTVRVDQPSLSFVSTLSEDTAPGVSIAVSP